MDDFDRAEWIGTMAGLLEALNESPDVTMPDWLRSRLREQISANDQITYGGRNERPADQTLSCPLH